MKQSVLTEAKGVPPAVVPSGANTHDMKLLNDTLDGLVVLRPAPTPEKPQNVCLDAGYTGAGEILAQRGFTAHIRPRGEEKHFLKGVCRTFHAAHIRPRGEEKGNCVTMDPTLKFGAHPPARGGEEVDCAFPGIQGVTLGCGGLPFPAQPFPQDTRAFREKSAHLSGSRAIHRTLERPARGRAAFSLASGAVGV